jgi:hypothetical protein
MSFIETLGIDWRNAAGEALQRPVSLTGDAIESRSVVVPDPASDVQVELSVDVSKIVLLYMVCSVDVDLDTNQVAPGVDTISLVAGVPIIWYSDCGWDIADLFSADLTDLYLNAADDGVGALEIRIVKDATP